MSVTLEDVTKKRPESSAEQAAAEDLVRQAREHGLPLTGPDGLLAASVPGSSRRFAGPASKRPGERAPMQQRGDIGVQDGWVHG